MRFQEIGVDVTTDVDRIATFLQKRPKGQKVIFTTYQSGNVTAKAALKAAIRVLMVMVGISTVGGLRLVGRKRAPSLTLAKYRPQGPGNVFMTKWPPCTGTFLYSVTGLYTTHGLSMNTVYHWGRYLVIFSMRNFVS